VSSPTLISVILLALGEKGNTQATQQGLEVIIAVGLHALKEILFFLVA
jgi:hypothetical protein